MTPIFIDPQLELVAISVYDLDFEVTVRCTPDGDGNTSWMDCEVEEVVLKKLPEDFLVERWPSYETIKEVAQQKAAEQRREK